MKFKFKLYEHTKIKYFKNLDSSFFILEYLNYIFYFKLIKTIQIIKKKKNLIFYSPNINFYASYLLKSFFFFFFNFYKTKNQKFCKKLILKGLGFKVISIIPNKYLELKIGFSHFVKIYFPKKFSVQLYVNKNMLVVEGSKKDFVGNFANKIKSFKLPDDYKGKGIWYKNEKRKKLKEIKKT